MRVFMIASVVGLLYAVGLTFVAVKYPGPVPWLPTPQDHAANLIMDALAPSATTTESVTSEAFISPEVVVDTALGNQPTVAEGYKEQEIISELFEAMARADKERFGILYTIDFERIYNPQVFDDHTEIEKWMQLFEGAQKEAEASLEAYYELRIKYAREALERYDAPEQSQENILNGLRQGAEVGKLYNIRYLGALKTHLEKLYALYAFMLAHQSEYEVVDDEEGTFVLFDTDELVEEYTTFAQQVDESSTLVDEAYAVLIEVTNANLKQVGLNLDAEEIFEKVAEKYY